MSVKDILESKITKHMEKRNQIVMGLESKVIDISEIYNVVSELTDKNIAIIIEAMEEITRTNPEISTSDWLCFCEKYINSSSNSLKRESSRVIGNIAHLYETNLETCIKELIANTTNDGTVVRWGSAYALAKIIVLPNFSNSPLFDTLSEICENETENGVKNQYLKALKKVSNFRTK